jgi:predicted RNA-binding protein with PIN domain
LIDGYNLLHASSVTGSGGRTPLERSREALLDWLGEVLSESQRQRTTIVFDARHAPPGLPRSVQRHGLRIRFASRGCEADDLLEELILQHSSPRSLIVVSSDHRLHRAARRRRATAVDSDHWIADIERRPDESPAEAERRDEMDPEEVEQWLKEFDDESSG